MSYTQVEGNLNGSVCWLSFLRGLYGSVIYGSGFYGRSWPKINAKSTIA